MMTSARPQGSASPGTGRLRELEAQARHGGSPGRVARQHAKGKYTARERLDLLLDPGTLQEIDAFARRCKDGVPGDRVVTVLLATASSRRPRPPSARRHAA
jgi:acetyl-CoA carboxylase carboxyltransferase component